MATSVTGTIYKIENTANGKVYIGQTGNWRLRLRQHRSDLKRGRHGNDHLQRAYNKYGKQSFIFTILADNLPEQYIDDMERGFIANFRTMDSKFGYNKESGGCANKILSSETREKLRQASLNMSEETKQKMRESKLAYYANGGVHPQQGAKKSPESNERNRQKILKWYADGNVNPNKGRKISQEVIEKGRQTNRVRLKPVYSHSEDFIYPSLTIASTLLGLKKSSLSSAIRRNLSLFGMRFSYLT